MRKIQKKTKIKKKITCPCISILWFLIILTSLQRTNFWSKVD